MNNCFDKKISIIVPIFNSERTLNKTIESILEQSYNEIEVLLIDDGSTDRSYKIAEQYSNKDYRIRLFKQDNKGVSSARNLGIEKSNGYYITFVDSDDEIDKDYLENMINVTDKYNPDIVASNITVKSDKLMFNPYEKYGNVLLEGEKILKAYLRFNISTAIWGKLFKKSVIENLKFPNININEDFIFQWNVIKKTTKFYQTNNTHYYYNISSSESLSNRKFSKDNMSIIEHALEVKEDIKKDYPSLLLEAEVYFKACVLHNLIIYYKYLTENDKEELYLDEVKYMCKILKNNKKLDAYLVESDKEMEIPELIDNINKILDRKVINNL